MDQNNPVIQKGLRLCFIFLLTAAGLGEWKTLNNMLGGLPKAITVGIICMTIAYAIIFPDLKRFKQLKGPTLFYMSLITALLLWSMVIWILNFMNLSSMIRGCSKVIFQSIAILTALSCRSSGSVCCRHVPGKRGDHGIGDSILWYCSEYTVPDHLSGDLR